MSEQVQGTAAPSPEAAPSSTAPTSGAAPEQVAQLQQVAQSGTPKEQAAAKKMLKKLSFKVDGQEVSEELPFEIPEEHAEYMKKQLSLNKAATKRMEHSAQLEKEIKQFFGNLKGNTKDTLSKLGIDPKQFAAQMLEEELRQSQLTPEQRELEELKAKLKSEEEARKTREEEFTKKELERATEAEYTRISSKIESALKTSGLPQEPSVVKRIANYLLIGNQMGIKLDPAEVTEIVKEDMFNEIQGYIKALGVDKVESLVGKDLLNQLRKKNVAKAKLTPATAKSGIKDTGTKSKEEPKVGPKKTFKDHFGF